MGYPRLSVRTRLLDNRIIDSVTGCWLWTKSINERGYGLIAINRMMKKVHRVSYQEFVGPIVNQINHKRNCPYKHCFNPEHLYDGTQSDNRVDDIVTNNRKIIGRQWNNIKN